MKKLVISILLISISTTGISQKVNKKDSTVIKQIFDTSLTDGASYEWLDYMSNNIGSRLSGSLGAELAVTFTKEQMEELREAVADRPARPSLRTITVDAIEESLRLRAQNSTLSCVKLYASNVHVNIITILTCIHAPSSGSSHFPVTP